MYDDILEYAVRVPRVGHIVVVIKHLNVFVGSVFRWWRSRKERVGVCTGLLIAEQSGVDEKAFTAYRKTILLCVNDEWAS